MADRIPDALMPHRNTSYKPFLATTPTGKKYGPAVTPERCQVEEKNRLIRNNQGKEVVSSTTVYLDPDHVVPVGSLYRVHIGTPHEKESTVITAAFLDNPNAPSHVVLMLE
ncbi:hypothetical protein [Plantibacter sp. YIM 135249]|uniref:hypothetical protein n=1 Tax=Plantibacter sp. YIM 135249 TaxID=3423918 RepID=UPI003D333499